MGARIEVSDRVVTSLVCHCDDFGVSLRSCSSDDAVGAQGSEVSSNLENVERFEARGRKPRAGAG